MKTSKYNILINSMRNGETILYNSLYGSLSAWNKEEIEVVKHIFTNPTQTEDKESIIKDVLIEQKYLIADYIDEISIIENRKRLGIKDNNRLDVVIMPTLECNFSCKYCYEVHRPSRMKDETEIAIKKWLTAQMPKYKFVMLHWYGGEPLLCYDLIASISRHMTNVAVESGVSHVIHITTNGYLLNAKKIKGLINEGIYDFQITVDGTPETHDKLRVLKNGNGTFRRLFQNINDIARADERVKISLRVNFNHDNLHSIPQLLKMFPSDVRPHLRVVYEPIFGDCSLSATSNIPSQEISKAMANYYKMARQLGYDVVLGLSGIYTGKLVYCYAERENQFIINYNGDVYKCSVSEFKPEERSGYIGDDGVFVKENNWDKWVSLKMFEEKCYSCVYLPLCMGGCRKTRLQHQETGSYCSLVPTNASYLLKQIALGGVEDIFCKEIERHV